ncbi:flagellar basal body L-ring protein FlgH [Chromatium okenii]|jgi:flagellar L-ring protein precursor FlgH|uniref:Flagellar L-ring protein n=1 Tax=Chromatium okenii TaxID=61644 RepID=A0A2S7XPC1_9GAMM|nr:flagellar basal body L-ring protein FlgH [Chromatium okenii]PQJ95278.1 flagellar basal body L-ring protein FlgH [Chromatium okenii]
MRTLKPLLLLLTLGLTACSSLKPPQPGDSSNYRPTPPQPPLPANANRGAIFQAAQSQGLFEDYKARRVGDLVQVQLAEKTNAKKSTATSTAKTSDISMNVDSPSIAGRSVIPGALPLLTGGSTGDRTFDGSGDSSQSNQLSGDITVTVAEVLPNGNLVVQGEKWLGINQGNEFVRLRGIIRPVDISATNTVLSTQIANAELYYGGTGAVQDSNAQGWLSRFFNHPLWPI